MASEILSRIGQACGIHSMPDHMQEPQPSPIAQIPVRTYRQAMDWSLVLASQEIEHRIEHSEGTGWALMVGVQDRARSLAVLRQYRLENQHWPWRKTIAQAGAVFDWGCIAWVLLTAAYFWLSEARGGLRTVGMTDGAALARGEWWRLFTATLLHADLAHLAMNTVFAFVLLGLAMGRFGTGTGLLAAYLAGAGRRKASRAGRVRRGDGGVGVAGHSIGRAVAAKSPGSEVARWRSCWGVDVICIARFES